MNRTVVESYLATAILLYSILSMVYICPIVDCWCKDIYDLDRKEKERERERGEYDGQIGDDISRRQLLPCRNNSTRTDVCDYRYRLLADIQLAIIASPSPITLDARMNFSPLSSVYRPTIRRLISTRFLSIAFRLFSIYLIPHTKRTNGPPLSLLFPFNENCSNRRRSNGTREAAPSFHS